MVLALRSLYSSGGQKVSISKFVSEGKFQGSYMGNI